jgi:hypothetical protein
LNIAYALFRIFPKIGESPNDKPKKQYYFFVAAYYCSFFPFSSTVRLAIRKLTYCPQVERPQPMVDVTKEFMISPGGLHLEASLDKEVVDIKNKQSH